MDAIFSVRLPFMVRGCHKICSILPLLVRMTGGDVCLSVTILSVTILKNPYKAKTNKARMLSFFLWRVPIMVRGCHEICSILPLLVRAPGGDVCLSVTILSVTILKNTYKTNTNKARMLFFLWRLLIMVRLSEILISEIKSLGTLIVFL